LQPPLALTSIPDAVLGTEHPSPPLAVEHGEVANRKPKSSCLKIAVTTLIDENPVSSLGIRERIDSHGESMGRIGRLNRAGVESAEPGAPG
jgi:hypothetical protein